MSTLTDFLLARIAEDEQAARAVTGVSVAYRAGWQAAPTEPLWSFTSDRVLAECEAKRRIVEEHAVGDPWADEDDSPWCKRCHDNHRHDAHSWPCPTLLHVASVYAGHPDFRNEWRP